METVNGEYLERGVQIGVDIGQRVDPTAIVVAERQLRGYMWPNPDIRRSDDRPIGGEIYYAVRFVERLPLNTSYPKVADRLAEVFNRLDSASRYPADPHIEMVRGKGYNVIEGKRVHNVYVDATGVGTPVVDLLKDKNIHPLTAVYLTGGEKATYDYDELRLAKQLLVSRLQVLLQQRRIELPDTAEARALSEELLNYEIKVNENANLQAGVFKTGKHDDLATALGLACWDDNSIGTITFGLMPQALVDALQGVRDDSYYRN